MAFTFEGLDEETRALMLDELERDLDDGSLYMSKRLLEGKEDDYVEALRQALKDGDETTLAQSIRQGKMLKSRERRRKPSGGFTTAKVPRNAHETLAEGEFNRFYIRGLCRRTLDQGDDEVEVYRAKEVRDPRPESERLRGQTLDAASLLEDLREEGVEAALGLPPGPNSGLSARLL